MISRRSLIRSVGAILAAPAIVRAASLMPVRSLAPPNGLTLLSTQTADGVPMLTELWILGRDEYGKVLWEKTVTLGDTVIFDGRGAYMPGGDNA